jgi:hypothetical protein
MDGIAPTSGTAGTQRPVAIERALILPGGPDDARQFVGECDRGFVVAAAFGGGDGPGPQPVEWSAPACHAQAGIEHGACAVDQQCAQVHIATFADAPEPAALNKPMPGMSSSAWTVGSSRVSRASSLERSVRGSSERAAGARTIIALAARWLRLARPAQRGR